MSELNTIYIITNVFICNRYIFLTMTMVKGFTKIINKINNNKALVVSE